MDALDNFNACQAITSSVDGLSNWYVRRSRDRFWASADAAENKQDKDDAYWTLYETLRAGHEADRALRPVPGRDAVASSVGTVFRSRSQERPSVRLPDADQRASIDDDLSKSMKLLREIASLGRAARADAKAQGAFPLSRVEVVLKDDSQIAWLKTHDELVREELNVKTVEYTTDGDQYVQYTVVPNFKLLGPKVGKRVPAVKKALQEADGNALLQALQSDGSVTIELARWSR